VIVLQNFKVAIFAALISSLIFTTSLGANYSYDGEGLIEEKALNKLKEIGDELYQKTGISTVLVVKKHLTQEQFLEYKDRYLKELKAPYILWIFSQKYIDRERVGINKLFTSDEIKDKFDENSLFSPWGGTFSKIISIQKSDSDPTAAAFLNGYGDLVDMISKSYGVTLNSSIGDESKTAINYIRIFFYAVILFFLLRYIKIKYFKKEEN